MEEKFATLRHHIRGLYPHQSMVIPRTSRLNHYYDQYYEDSWFYSSHPQRYSWYSITIARGCGKRSLVIGFYIPTLRHHPGRLYPLHRGTNSSTKSSFDQYCWYSLFISWKIVYALPKESTVDFLWACFQKATKVKLVQKVQTVWAHLTLKLYTTTLVNCPRVGDRVSWRWWWWWRRRCWRDRGQCFQRQS